MVSVSSLSGLMVVRNPWVNSKTPFVTRAILLISSSVLLSSERTARSSVKVGVGILHLRARVSDEGASAAGWQLHRRSRLRGEFQKVFLKCRPGISN